MTPRVEIHVDVPTQTVTFRHFAALALYPVEIVVPFAAIESCFLAILTARLQPSSIAPASTGISHLRKES